MVVPHWLGFFFQYKVHFFRTGWRKLERIRQKAGEDSWYFPHAQEGWYKEPADLFFLEVKLHFLGCRPPSYLGEAQFSRLDTVPLSYFSLFLPQGPSLSILSVLKSIIKK